MFEAIKTYFSRKKKKKELKIVLQLLYSNKIYTIDELINTLSLNDNLKILEFYIIITIATKLKRPFTEDDITEIYTLQIRSLKFYTLSQKNTLAQRDIVNVFELEKGVAESSLNLFNAEMDFLRSLYKGNKYSRHGMLLSMMIAKGRPLSYDEEKVLDMHYEKIKTTQEKHNALYKEASELFKKENP